LEHLTFRGYPSLNKALHIFDTWLREIEQQYGTPSFRFFRVTEYGALRINIHFHILVGGIRPKSGDRYMAILRWQELAGEGNISSFAGRNGIFYILKTLRPGRDLEIDFRLDSPPEKRA
jgi:hypothetical protein